MKSKKIDLTFPDDLLVGRTPEVYAVVAPPTASLLGHSFRHDQCSFQLCGGERVSRAVSDLSNQVVIAQGEDSNQ